MPYYVHPKEIEPTADNIGSLLAEDRCSSGFVDRTSAHAECQSRGVHAFKVTYVESESEHEDWTSREYRRQTSGDYAPVPWPGKCEGPVQFHYAHRAIKTPALIAYTPSAEHGFQDRQVSCKPGKYLEEFYSEYSLETRRAWIAELQAEDVSFTLARTPDEIERVYRGNGYASIPFRSCMGPDRHVDFDRDHPTRVYGDSDLAVAYLGPMDAVLARCVVWPDKQRYSRVYGSETLTAVMRAAGYEHGSMVGANIRAVRSGSSWLMPYIDGVSWAKKDGTGKYFILGSGGYPTTNTHGRTGPEGDEDEDNEDDEPQTMTCDRCGSQTEYDEDSSYCPDCEDERLYCRSCNQDFWGTSYYDRESEEYVCESCSEQTESTCVHCDETWYERQLYRKVQIQRYDDHVTDLCVECADLVTAGTLAHCSACDVWYSPENSIQVSRCPEYNHVRRCEHTGDLLAGTSAQTSTASTESEAIL